MSAFFMTIKRCAVEFSQKEIPEHEKWKEETQDLGKLDLEHQNIYSTHYILLIYCREQLAIRLRKELCAVRKEYGKIFFQLQKEKDALLLKNKCLTDQMQRMKEAMYVSEQQVARRATLEQENNQRKNGRVTH